MVTLDRLLLGGLPDEVGLTAADLDTIRRYSALPAGPMSRGEAIIHLEVCARAAAKREIREILATARARRHVEALAASGAIEIGRAE